MCLVALVAWILVSPLIFPPKAPPAVEQAAPKPEQPQQPAVQRDTTPELTKTDTAAEGTAAEEASAEPQTAIPAKTIKLENEFIRLKVSNYGGTIVEGELLAREYREDAGSEKPLRLLTVFDGTPMRTLGMQFESGADLTRVPFETVGQPTSSSVTYSTKLDNGLEVTKTISLPKGTYHADVTVRIKNGSADEAVETSYWLTSAAGILPEVPAWLRNENVPPSQLKAAEIEGAIGGKTSNGTFKVVRSGPGSVQKQPEVYDLTPAGWAGVKNQFFSAVLRPKRLEPSELRLSDETLAPSGKVSAVGLNNVAASLGSGKVKIEAGGSITDSYIFFLGPNKADLLTNPDYAPFAEFHGLPWPAVITGLFRGILHAFHSVVRNYGMAIIMLTLLVRVVLHPLSRKSQKSMHAMQKLGPKMKEIKDKYKDDKKRQQEETMKLYREYGVNPMGGCLPILLQLPILIGLYGALRSAIELRHAPFMLWMNDLSQQDRLLILPDSVPFLGGGPLNVLPILMIAAMFAQQKMSPKSGDPQSEQTQKIMLWLMPALFGWMFYGMPSGLVLYFMTSTALGALESHLIRRHLDKLELAPVKPDTKKKSKSWLDQARARTARGRKSK